MPNEISISGDKDKVKNGYIYKELSSRITKLESEIRDLVNTTSALMLDNRNNRRMISENISDNKICNISELVEYIDKTAYKQMIYPTDSFLIINHMLNSEIINIKIKKNNKEVILPYEILNKDSIKIKFTSSQQNIPYEVIISLAILKAE